MPVTRFALFDANGKVTGIWSDDVFPDVVTEGPDPKWVKPVDAAPGETAPIIELSRERNPAIPAGVTVIRDTQWHTLIGNPQSYWDAATGDVVDHTTPPVVVIEVVNLFRAMTDAEVSAMQSAVAQQPARIQAIFNKAVTFRSDAPEWPLLQQMATQLYGPDRAAQLLAGNS